MKRVKFASKFMILCLFLCFILSICSFTVVNKTNNVNSQTKEVKLLQSKLNATNLQLQKLKNENERLKIQIADFDKKLAYELAKAKVIEWNEGKWFINDVAVNEVFFDGNDISSSVGLRNITLLTNLSNGKPAPNYKGTIYIPIDTVSRIFSKQFNWDESNGILYVGQVSSNSN